MWHNLCFRKLKKKSKQPFKFSFGFWVCFKLSINCAFVCVFIWFQIKHNNSKSMTLMGVGESLFQAISFALATDNSMWHIWNIFHSIHWHFLSYISVCLQNSFTKFQGHAEFFFLFCSRIFLHSYSSIWLNKFFFLKEMWPLSNQIFVFITHMLFFRLLSWPSQSKTAFEIDYQTSEALSFSSIGTSRFQILWLR